MSLVPYNPNQSAAAVPQQQQPQAAFLDRLEERIRYAEVLAKADLLPAQFRGKPGNVLMAMEFGSAMGLTPLVSMLNIHVIEGKPSSSATLIAALITGAGHTLTVSDPDPARAVAEIVRRDRPGHTYRSTWTIERAQRAGLVGKDTWKKYPEAMLRARAITEVCRAACPELLLGVRYTPEELGAQVDQTGEPVTGNIVEDVVTVEADTSKAYTIQTAAPEQSTRARKARNTKLDERQPEPPAEAQPAAAPEPAPAPAPVTAPAPEPAATVAPPADDKPASVDEVGTMWKAWKEHFGFDRQTGEKIPGAPEDAWKDAFPGVSIRNATAAQVEAAWAHLQQQSEGA